MPSPVASLFWITVVAAVAPFLAGMVPRRLVPEVVLLLVGGTIIGPYVLGLAVEDEAIEMLKQLGLGLLFLLAGYEIEVKELTDRLGRRALVTWLVCIGLALALVGLLGATGRIHAEIAVAIALTSTALGTLLPILRDGGQLGTPFGSTLLRHGAVGELGPVVAMAVLLGTRGAVMSLVVLALFVGIAALAVVPTRRIQRAESWVLATIRAGTETTAQTAVRLTVLLLVTLGALATAFQLDAILGAFAAGLILRYLIPGGDERLESKLDGLAFGLLIPVFFVVSGMAIDPAAVASAPVLLVTFVILIVVVRGGPVLLATLAQREPDGARSFDRRDSVRMALYGATGLPIIVAVTAIAVHAGEMSTATASVLVAGGALTVLLLPMAATLLSRRQAEVLAPSD